MGSKVAQPREQEKDKGAKNSRPLWSKKPYSSSKLHGGMELLTLQYKQETPTNAFLALNWEEYVDDSSKKCSSIPSSDHSLPPA